MLSFVIQTVLHNQNHFILHTLCSILETCSVPNHTQYRCQHIMPTNRVAAGETYDILLYSILLFSIIFEYYFVILIIPLSSSEMLRFLLKSNASRYFILMQFSPLMSSYNPGELKGGENFRLRIRPYLKVHVQCPKQVSFRPESSP